MVDENGAHCMLFKGEDVAITRAVDTIDYCLRDELAYCTDVPLQFKDPSKAMYAY